MVDYRFSSCVRGTSISRVICFVQVIESRMQNSNFFGRQGAGALMKKRDTLMVQQLKLEFDASHQQETALDDLWLRSKDKTTIGEATKIFTVITRWKHFHELAAIRTWRRLTLTLIASMCTWRRDTKAESQSLSFNLIPGHGRAGLNSCATSTLRPRS